ncbi:hypothetical protein VTO73DRAFT_1203 [Trametes versicolor]
MDDPGLASEMIKLLRDELERIREQIREARSLSREVNQREQLASQLELTSKSEAEVASLSQKVTVAREKRQQTKSSKSQLEDSISALEHHLAQLKTRRVEEQERLEVLQNELESRRAHTSTPFDPFSDIVAYIRATPGGARSVCSGWARCVFLATTHRYNPKLTIKGGWEPTWDMEERRGVRDLFYMKDKKWYYIGTYQWTGQAVFQYKEIRKLIFPHMHHLRSRTVLFPDSLPPVLTGIARTLIESGALKIACTGWRWVGFNNKLAEALRSVQPSTSAVDDGTQHPRPSNIIAVPKEGAREAGKKAKKREGSDAQDGPKKKRKRS